MTTKKKETPKIQTFVENDEQTKRRWLLPCKKILLGRKITSVRYMTEQERKGLGWSHASVVIHLDDNTLLYPSADDEGNEAGALFTTHENLQTIPVI